MESKSSSEPTSLDGHSTQPSLQSIAQKAGVSAMTVSRVLHNSPRVSEATRKRVHDAANALRYQPDPHLARMMHLVRSRKIQRHRAVIAIVREDRPHDELHSSTYQYVATSDIARRAAQHGYDVEDFHLGYAGMTPGRLCHILHSRGIEGMIVSPQSSQMLCSQLEYAEFAAATFGYGLLKPSLHRSAGNMTLGIHLAVSELGERGYKRIGMAVTRWVDDRSEHTYTASMLHFQKSLPRSQRVPTLIFPHNRLAACGPAFRSWMKTYRPDALISFDTFIPEWLRKMGLRIPEDIGLVVHDWHSSMHGLAGIHQRRDHVAAAAVDLVATQLLHHERGIPEVPRQILIPPAWIDGESLRPKA